MSIRANQVLHVLRTYGAVEALKRANRALVRERADVPFRERLWLWRHQFKPISYILYGFADKSEEQRLEYLADIALTKMRRINRGPNWFLESKLIFYRMISIAGIRGPELVATVRGGHMVEASPPYREIRPDDLAERGDDFFIKPFSGGRGVGVRRVRADQLTSMVFDPRRPFLIVKTIRQAEYSRNIFEHAFNTIRAVALRQPGTREVFVPCAVHRFGSVKTAPLDSFSKGGLSCEIDLDSGRLGRGIRHPSETGGVLLKYTHHPDSAALLEGVRIPDWSGAVNLVHDLMNLLPEIEFAGWDLLPTDEGWAVIEGNITMGIDVLQVHRGLLSDPQVKEFARYHDLA